MGRKIEPAGADEQAAVGERHLLDEAAREDMRNIALLSKRMSTLNANGTPVSDLSFAENVSCSTLCMWTLVSVPLWSKKSISVNVMLASIVYCQESSDSLHLFPHLLGESACSNRAPCCPGRGRLPQSRPPLHGVLAKSPTSAQGVCKRPAILRRTDGGDESRAETFPVPSPGLSSQIVGGATALTGHGSGSCQLAAFPG
jgi:hypothetical protein